MIILVIGVESSGKTTIGKMIAERVHFAFADADDFHSAANKEKMSHGIPLTDADRLPWLAAIREQILRWIAAETDAVVTCSALKQSYRDFLVYGRALHIDGGQSGVGAANSGLMEGATREAGSAPSGARSDREGVAKPNLAIDAATNAAGNARASVAANAATGVAANTATNSAGSSFSTSDSNAGVNSEQIKILYLRGTYEVIDRRLRERHNHFAGEDLLKSQFATLEEPHDAITVDIDQTEEQIVEEALQRLHLE